MNGYRVAESIQSDVPPAPEEVGWINDRLKAAFAELELPTLACPAQVYVGGKELTVMRMVQEEAVSHWQPNAQGIVVPGVGHEVLHESYLSALKDNGWRAASVRTRCGSARGSPGSSRGR